MHLLSDKLQQWIYRIYFISMESGKDMNPFEYDLSAKLKHKSILWSDVAS